MIGQIYQNRYKHVSDNQGCNHCSIRAGSNKCVEMNKIVKSCGHVTCFTQIDADHIGVTQDFMTHGRLIRDESGGLFEVLMDDGLDKCLYIDPFAGASARERHQSHLPTSNGGMHKRYSRVSESFKCEYTKNNIQSLDRYCFPNPYEVFTVTPYPHNIAATSLQGKVLRAIPCATSSCDSCIGLVAYSKECEVLPVCANEIYFIEASRDEGS
jgi:hypothetical protein